MGVLLGEVDLVERHAERLSQFQGIVISPEVHEKQVRLLSEHMAVERRHFDTVLTQSADHWIRFAGNQNKVAGNRRAFFAGGLEIDGIGDPHRRRYFHVVVHNFLGAGDTELVHTAVRSTFLAQNLINLFGIEV